jgi:hypothetical protein
MSTSAGQQPGETGRCGWVCYLAYVLPVSAIRKEQLCIII